MVPLHLFLAAHLSQRVQEGGSHQRVRRPNPDQYARYRTSSDFFGSSPPASLCHKVGNYWREPRHASYGRRVRPEVWTASPACARDGGSLLQRAVHCSEQHYFRLRWQTHHRDASGRLSHHGTGLERTGAERDEADFVAEQFGIRHRPHPRIQRQRPSDRLRAYETDSDRPQPRALSMMRLLTALVLGFCLASCSSSSTAPSPPSPPCCGVTAPFVPGQSFSVNPTSVLFGNQMVN